MTSSLTADAPAEAHTHTRSRDVPLYSRTVYGAINLQEVTSRRWLFAEILARAPRDGIHESDTLKGHPFSSKLISLRSTVPWTSLNEGDIALV